MTDTTFLNVNIKRIDEHDNLKDLGCGSYLVKRVTDCITCYLYDTDNEAILNFNIDTNTKFFGSSPNGFFINIPDDATFLVKFASADDADKFNGIITSATSKDSAFNQRTEQASAKQYFQFYSYLSQQQNMMQDYVRTSTYQSAMLQNYCDFQNKVVLDVGAGSGILSFFAVQAGAKKVYAVEASSISHFCELLVQKNNLSNKIIVIHGKIEEIELPEQVDVIVSEPMGLMLYNERMLESFVHARKFLVNDGLMFPTQGDLYFAPFTDEALYMEQYSKSNFWFQHSFYGVDISHLQSHALEENFKQPIVDTFDMRILLAKSQKYSVNFLRLDESFFQKIEIPFEFTLTTSGMVHGLAFWFEVGFFGSNKTIFLSTAPHQPLTHWYQVRCLLKCPFLGSVGQIVSGNFTMKANIRQSYDMEVEIGIKHTSMFVYNTYDLKSPFFRYTGFTPPPPQGSNFTSPTEAYWNHSNSNPVNINNSEQVASYDMTSYANHYPTPSVQYYEQDYSHYHHHHNINNSHSSGSNVKYRSELTNYP